MPEKGISPIISAVLLLAVSLSVAALFSGWGPQTAKDLFETTGNQSEETAICSSANIEILYAEYSNDTVGEDNVTAAVKVEGIDELESMQLSAWSDSDLLMSTSERFNLSEGVIGNKTVAVSNEPARIEATSKRCPDAATETTDIT